MYNVMCVVISKMFEFLARLHLKVEAAQSQPVKDVPPAVRVCCVYVCVFLEEGKVSMIGHIRDLCVAVTKDL